MSPALMECLSAAPSARGLAAMAGQSTSAAPRRLTELGSLAGRKPEAHRRSMAFRRCAAPGPEPERGDCPSGGDMSGELAQSTVLIVDDHHLVRGGLRMALD